MGVRMGSYDPAAAAAADDDDDDDDDGKHLFLPLLHLHYSPHTNSWSTGISVKNLQENSDLGGALTSCFWLNADFVCGLPMLSHSFKAHLVINQTMIESGLSLSLIILS